MSLIITFSRQHNFEERKNWTPFFVANQKWVYEKCVCNFGDRIAIFSFSEVHDPLRHYDYGPDEKYTPNTDFKFINKIARIKLANLFHELICPLVVVRETIYSRQRSRKKQWIKIFVWIFSCSSAGNKINQFDRRRDESEATKFN